MAFALAMGAAITVPATPSRALAAEPLARASMQCERAAEPGRVRCSVEGRAEGGRTIAWADVVIVDLPSFAAPLKGRIAQDDATAKDSANVKWAFGIIAKRAGSGEARARVRMTICEPVDGGTGRCVPFETEVHATLVVG